MSSPDFSRTRARNIDLLTRSTLALYSGLLAAAVVASAPWWLVRMATTRRYRQGLPERLGFVPKRVQRPVPGAKVAWLHAVSVGEVLAISRLISELRGAGRQVYISTTTRTGQALARERFGADSVFYYPFDFAFAVRAWLRHLRPSVFILAESEFWPRMLTECARAGVPVVLVNARISDRSWPRYQRLRRLWRPLLAGLAVTLAQSDRDAERLRALGAANVALAGNLKFDVRPPAEARFTAELRGALPQDAVIVVCGSTLEGEEALLLRAFEGLGGLADRLIVVFAPRHPERFSAVAELLAQTGRALVRRSEWQNAPVAPGTLILLDSIGELASVFSLATLACVGGSWFPPGGGHNPLEPALLGVPVVTGPYTANFASIIGSMQAADAIAIAGDVELQTALGRLLADEFFRREIGERARRFAQSEAGATARSVAAIEDVLAGGQ